MFPCMDSDLALEIIAGLRILLLALDFLDERFPKVKPVTALLGTLLGGSRQR